MKRSYFQAPRTMNEATFYSWGCAIESPARHSRPSSVSLLIAAGVLLIFILAAVVVSA